VDDQRRSGAVGSGGPGQGALALGGSGTASQPPGAEYGPYLNLFRKQVQTVLQYPLTARRRGLAGKVELDVSIDRTGAVTGVVVAASSSHEALDGAAVAAVRAVPPLPFPAGLPARPLRVRLPLVFELH